MVTVRVSAAAEDGRRSRSFNGEIYWSRIEEEANVQEILTSLVAFTVHWKKLSAMVGACLPWDS